jgi:hypothetical protein
MDAILSAHSFGATCYPHCYLTSYARCMWTDSIFAGMGGKKYRGSAEIFGPPLKILSPDRPGSRGLCIPVQYRFNKSPLLVSIPSQFNPDEMWGFHGCNIFPYVKKCHIARIWGSHSGIAKDSRHLEILYRKCKALCSSETPVTICQSTQRNIPEECPDTHRLNVEADHTLHTSHPHVVFFLINSSKRLFPSVFFVPIFVRLSHLYYVFCPSHSSWFDHPNNILWTD